MTRLNSTDIGTPCKLGYMGRDAGEIVVGRIVEHSILGSTAMVRSGPNAGKSMNSVVFWGTPHNTVVMTGIFHLLPLNDEEMKKLLEFEADARAKNVLYTNYPEVQKLLSDVDQGKT